MDRAVKNDKETAQSMILFQPEHSD